METLVDALLRGERRALARLLTIVENEREGMNQALTALFPHTGRAWVIGVTGAPGTGKSTLVNALTKAYREVGKTVGIIAVDPTSPYSGGAILGDRIRMRDLSGDSGVFIRSMATRGSLGGLSRATRDAIRVMDAAGFDIILVETVGAGQSEVDIVRTAQTTLVVEAPGLGDDVQAIKAGILEIADVLVVNKADRPGVENTVRGLRAMLELGHPASRSQLVQHHGQLVPVDSRDNSPADPLWLPPIVRTVSTEESGIEELVTAIENHRAYLGNEGVLEVLERQHIEIELVDRLRTALMSRLLNVVPQDAITTLIHQVQTREYTPQEAVSVILKLHDEGLSGQSTISG
ncbi:MAG: methylmalonyl Co-A mutase-associated GTPase MeaB [Anaerolineaceae bacterium]|nr:methylmalonyl Co-A mutase-associated GTPase MeaB [Anaerolineaceae bacterium]